eukprot:gene12969-biopygen5721
MKYPPVIYAPYGFGSSITLSLINGLYIQSGAPWARPHTQTKQSNDPPDSASRTLLSARLSACRWHDGTTGGTLTRVLARVGC